MTRTNSVTVRVVSKKINRDDCWESYKMLNDSLDRKNIFHLSLVLGDIVRMPAKTLLAIYFARSCCVPFIMCTRPSCFNVQGNHTVEIAPRVQLPMFLAYMHATIQYCRCNFCNNRYTRDLVSLHAAQCENIP